MERRSIQMAYMLGFAKATLRYVGIDDFKEGRVPVVRPSWGHWFLENGVEG